MARKKSHPKQHLSVDGNDDSTPPVIGIGASAGGLASFTRFISGIPLHSNLAFLLVQHLDPAHPSLLASLLQTHTMLSVVQVEDGMRLAPNTIYVIPPNADMAVLHGTLRLMEPTEKKGQRLPIDFLFRSLAADQREKAIGIILSGNGTDGTLGLKAIKEQGGMVMVEEPTSAEYPGMPNSALATGLVDYVLPIEAMPTQLLSYIQHMMVPGSHMEGLALKAGELMQKVCIVLRAETGHDFSMYKDSTFTRRLERRMVVHEITDPARYLRLLQNSPEEVDTLFRELLIGVTSFFRDPEAFEALDKYVIPRLFENRLPDRAIRVWVAGCSTGEEAYTIGMLIRQQMDLTGQEYDVQIFATDIDERAIAKARQGLYPPNIEADVPAYYLRRFFTRDGQNYQIVKQIRDMMVFAVHSVIKDPPFSKIDLLSFRNVQIYFEASLQKLILPAMHYALNPGGFLFLGTSETLGEFDFLFKAIDRKSKLFERDVSGLARLSLTPPLAASVLDRQHPPTAVQEKKRSLRDLIEKRLLANHTPPAVVVNAAGEIVYFHNRTGSFLEPPSGDPGHRVTEMARDGLRVPLRSALHRAIREKQEIVVPNVRVLIEGNTQIITLRVTPIDWPQELQGLFTILFEPMQIPNDLQRLGATAFDGDRDQRVAELELELQNTQEYLQSTIQELEAANEELKSTNEEYQSANEELQSTNEELETAKEELQSVNEEMVTVNSELQIKNEGLAQINADLNNLLANVDVAIIFLDQHLNIQRFNPAATQFINLLPTDIGRPLTHLASNLAYDDLFSDIQAVLDTLEARDEKVHLRDGSSYLMRIRPYRTATNAIDGVILIFMDIIVQQRTE